jgi:hypothetical protein
MQNFKSMFITSFSRKYLKHIVEYLNGLQILNSNKTIG